MFSLSPSPLLEIVITSVIDGLEFGRIKARYLGEQLNIA
jgi:hypothetical protein